MTTTTKVFPPDPDDPDDCVELTIVISDDPETKRRMDEVIKILADILRRPVT